MSFNRRSRGAQSSFSAIDKRGFPLGVFESLDSRTKVVLLNRYFITIRRSVVCSTGAMTHWPRTCSFRDARDQELKGW